jgi:hypothetical protein
VQPVERSLGRVLVDREGVPAGPLDRFRDLLATRRLADPNAVGQVVALVRLLDSASILSTA